MSEHQEVLAIFQEIMLQELKHQEDWRSKPLATLLSEQRKAIEEVSRLFSTQAHLVLDDVPHFQDKLRRTCARAANLGLMIADRANAL